MGGSSKKSDARAEDIAKSNLAAQQANADRLRSDAQGYHSEVLGAAQPTSGEQSVMNPYYQYLSGRIGQPGEQLFRGQGDISNSYANTVQGLMANPGKMYDDTTSQQTDKALETLQANLNARGVSPQSPYAITEGRREARDVAIQNAMNRINVINQDLNRGQQFTQQAGGLQSETTGMAGQLSENARQRQLQGTEAAGQLGMQGASGSASLVGNAISQKQDLETQMLANQIKQQQQQQQMLAHLGMTAGGVALGAATGGLGFLPGMAGGMSGAMGGASLGMNGPAGLSLPWQLQMLQNAKTPS